MTRPYDRVTVTAPPSKSLSHRALIAAALAPGASTLTGLLDSDDIRRTTAALCVAGAEVVRTGQATAVQGMAHGPCAEGERPLDLDMHESGTSCRLLTAVMAAGQGRFRIHGAPRLHQRPIASLAEALEAQGVAFRFEGQPGYPPFVMETRGLSGGAVTVSLEESSQYLSGLLLAAPLSRDTTVLGLGGTKVVSWPYVGLTLQVMREFGTAVAVETRSGSGWHEAAEAPSSAVHPGELRLIIPPGSYGARSYRVEGDWSNASYFLAAGAIGPRAVTVEGLRADSLQGDRRILELLEQFGAQVSWSGHAVTVAPAALRGVELDLGSCPDLVPTVVVLACFASGPTTIRNVAHLRIKESDRLAAPAAEIAKVGCRADLLDDGIRVWPASLPRGQAVTFAAWRDHRIAMSTALFGLAGIKTSVDTPDCVDKSFPDFWTEWAAVVGSQPT